MRILVEKLAGHVIADLGREQRADQPVAEAQRLVEHIEQHDIAENISEIERIDVAPRGEFAGAPLLLKIGIEPVQARLAQAGERIARNRRDDRNTAAMHAVICGPLGLRECYAGLWITQGGGLSARALALSS